MILLSFLSLSRYRIEDSMNLLNVLLPYQKIYNFRSCMFGQQCEFYDLLDVFNGYLPKDDRYFKHRKLVPLQLNLVHDYVT